MKKIAFTTAAAGLLSLTACGGNKSPEVVAVENSAEAMEASLENAADNMEAMADNTSNIAAAEAMENVADNLEVAKDNVADAANAKIDNMR